MIGQRYLKSQLDSWIESNKLPRFILLIGQNGSGRKTMCKYIAQKSKMNCVISEHSIDSIRNIVKQSYEVSLPTLYVIPDAGKLSNIAQNTLLKVTEEAPNNAYFVLTCESATQVLNTLVNRSFLMHMDIYTLGDLREYIEQNYAGKYDKDIFKTVLLVCTTPGDIDLMFTYDIEGFISYVIKVVDNITVSSGANAFKIGSKISFKDDDTEKYNLDLFFKMFVNECINRIANNDDITRYAKGIRVTDKYINDLRINGVNKSATFDMWVLDIRKEWR